MTTPPGFASKAEYDWYAAQFWAMKRRHDGYTAPLTTNQHILHLLLTVFTGGLWLIGWIICAIKGRRVPGDPTAPIPVWPPPGRPACTVTLPKGQVPMPPQDV